MVEQREVRTKIRNWERAKNLRSLMEEFAIGLETSIVKRMHIDDLVMRIRRLPSAKRKKLDEMVRSLEETPMEVAPTNRTVSRVALRPVHGLLRALGPAPSDEAIDEARGELWSGFPREDLL